MATTLTVSTAARNIFQTGMEQAAQQLQSRLRPYAVVKTGCTGKSQGHRKIQSVEMADSTGRLQATVGQELGLEHRYLFPRKAWVATTLDEDDAADLDLQVAPTGDISTQHIQAVGRKIDDIMIAGITGTNYEGVEDSMSSVTLPAGQTIAYNYKRDGTTADSGLTFAKLTAAKSLFAKAEIYGQEQKQAGAKLVLAVSQDELDDLLNDATLYVGSLDYNKLKALVDGEVDYFMGINFIRSERLATTTASSKLTRTCPMWVSTGIHLDFWYDVKTSIDVLPTVSQAIQVYSRLKAGCCRMSEKHAAIIQTIRAA